MAHLALQVQDKKCPVCIIFGKAKVALNETRDGVKS